MKKLRSLTIAIPDIVAIFAITDPAVREQAISILEKESADPEAADPERYADADPVIYRLVSNIRDRVAKSRRRAASRARRKAEQEAATTAEARPERESAKALRQAAEDAVSLLAPSPYDAVDYSLLKVSEEIIFDQSIVPALRWCDLNLGSAFRTVKDIFHRISYFTPLGFRRSKTIDSVLDEIMKYLTVYLACYDSYFKACDEAGVSVGTSVA